MASEKVHIVHSVNGTVVNAVFTCRKVSISMLPDCAVVTFDDGRDEAGARVIAALYRDPHTIIRYRLDG